MSTATDDQAQLGWEARAARYAAAAAFAVALLPVVGIVVSAATVGAPGEDAVERAMAIDREAAGYLAVGALQAVATALLAPVLAYLYRVVRARSDRPPPPPILVLAIVGPVAVAIVTFLFQVDRVDAVAAFLSGGEVTEDGAEEALGQAGSSALAGVAFGANLAVAVAIVVISLNAMRTGVLSRFMGILGIALGALSVVPLIPAPFLLQLLWAAALGFLFIGRWPGGRGPAWERVEAIPWPTAADRAQEQRDERVGEAQRIADRSAAESDREGSDETERARPASRKKRRSR